MQKEERITIKTRHQGVIGSKVRWGRRILSEQAGGGNAISNIGTRDLSRSTGTK